MQPHALLIEDDDAFRAAAIPWLLRRGWRVTACDSIAQATEALEHIVDAAIAPDTVICGIERDDGTGAAFRAESAQRFPRLKWIVTADKRDLATLATRLDAPAEPAAGEAPVQLPLLELFSVGAGRRAA